MSQLTNPFVRGYRGLHVQRLLAITDPDDLRFSVSLPLHASQAHLTDEEVQYSDCIACDDFALIIDGPPVPEHLRILCPSAGFVRAVVYAIMADDDGRPVHVGDTYSHEAARKVVQRLRFETGFYSRGWEISAGHITEGAMLYLNDLADAPAPAGLLFEAFRVRGSDAVGIKLIATPWTDANLPAVDGQSQEQLRQEHLRNGVPPSLVPVLHLAGLADVRILVFDPDALVLDGLPLYDPD